VAGETGSSPIRVLPLIGSIAVVVSVVQPWISGLGTVHAEELPVGYIVSGEIGSSKFSLGILLLLLATLGAILFSLDRWSAVRRTCGGVIMLLVVLFLAQLFSGGAEEQTGLRLTVDSIGVGPYFAFIGGALLAAG